MVLWVEEIILLLLQSLQSVASAYEDFGVAYQLRPSDVRAFPDRTACTWRRQFDLIFD